MNDQKDSVSDPLIGQVLGERYRLDRRLGAGGFGAVYLATHLSTGGAVAVKLLLTSHLADDNHVRRFQIEARNTHQLRHHNTVRVSDFGRTSDGLLYLVMEFIEGISLHQLKSAIGPLGTERTIRIATQILRSLEEAHRKQIVHRDIKPANVLISSRVGEPDFVKVVDFGISRALDLGGAGTVGVIGSPRYMSPEQCQTAHVDHRSDIYSVGLLMYELLCGRHPFAECARLQNPSLCYLAAHGAERPLDLGDVPGHDTASELVGLVMAMLEKRPEDRPGSAHEVLVEAQDDQREGRGAPGDRVGPERISKSESAAIR